MAWTHNGRTITIGTAWVSDDNKKYPRQWNNLTDAEKKSAGLVWKDDEVVETYDNRFYWSKGVERNLEDINVVDENGNEVIDPTTGKQMVQLGLKSIWIDTTKKTTNNLLSNTDWQITRKYEKGTAIPSATTTYRDKVRTACDTIETKINNCSNLTQLMALFDPPTDSDGNITGVAPIFDLPNE